MSHQFNQEIINLMEEVQRYGVYSYEAIVRRIEYWNGEYRNKSKVGFSSIASSKALRRMRQWETYAVCYRQLKADRDIEQ